MRAMTRVLGRLRGKSSRRSRRRTWFSNRRIEAALERLEDRTLLATFTLFPTVDGYASDVEMDGAFDSVETTETSIETQLFDPFFELPEQRGLLEFDLSGIPSSSTIVSATLTGHASLVQGTPADIEFRGYAGDGTLAPSDATAASSVIGGINGAVLGAFSTTLDPGVIQALLGTASHLGLSVRMVNGSRFYVHSSESSVIDARPRLIIETADASNNAPVANDDSYTVDEDSTLIVGGGFDPPNDLLLRYGFDEAASGAGPALDTGIAPATDGTFAGQATRTGSTPAGASIGALDLTVGADGNNYVTAGDLDEIDSLTQMTVTLWINLQGAPNENDILLSDTPPGLIGPAGSKGWQLTIARNLDDDSLSAGRFAVEFGTIESFDTFAQGTFLTANGFSADDAWAFVAVTFEQTTFNGESAGLVDIWGGNVSSSVTARTVTGLFDHVLGGPNDGALFIGGNDSSTTNGSTAPAWLDDVRIYNRALTQQELEAVRQEGITALAAAGVLQNDADADGDLLTAVLVDGPDHGALTFNADGTFTYTPNPGFSGSDSFTYKANDGTADSNVATVTITVNAVNDPPVAENDSYTTALNTPLTVAAPGVLANDADADGDTLTAALVAGPANGALTLNADGSFTYTPNADFSGTDSFTYRASDGTVESNTGTVTITVDPPEIGGDPPSVNFGFAHGLGDPALSGSAQRDWGFDVATDSSRNVYVTGMFAGTVDFDPSAGVFNLTSAGASDIFVAKYDVTGALVWARRMGGALNDRGSSIDVDSAGNVYLGGDFASTTADFGSIILNNTTADGFGDGFVAKLDTAGNTLWATKIGGNFNDATNEVTSDAAGNVYAAGLLDRAAFVQKMDASGNVVWQRLFSGGSLSFANAKGISVDDSGNVYTTGDFRRTVDFDPSGGTFNLTSASTVEDIFISKLDSSGALVWAQRIGGSAGDDRGDAIVVDGAGNAYVTGSFKGTVDFDPGAGTFNLATSGPSDPDAFVLKLDSAGALSWAGRMGGSQFLDSGRDIAVDEAGNVYTTGAFSIEADFDPDPTATFIQASAFDNSGHALDAYISKLDNNGQFVWVRTLGGFEDDQGYGIAVSDAGDIYTTGVFGGTVDFDPAVDSAFNVTANAWPDAFVSRLFESGPNPLLTVHLDRGFVLETDGPNAATGTVTRHNTDLSSPLVVTLSSSDTSAATVPLTVTIAAGEESATFFVEAVDDLLADGIQGTVISASASGLEPAGTRLTVVDANEDPVAADDSATTDEDTAVTIAVLANDTDVNGDPLTVTAVGTPQNGTAVINANGTLTYTPNASFNGTDTFTYTISDGKGGTATATVTVTIDPVNDAPIATGTTLTTDEDRAVDIDLRTLVTDVETADDDLVFTVSGAVNGTVELLGDGHTARFTPNADYFGPASFQYHVTDTGDGEAPPPTVVFDVTYTDDPGEGFFDSVLGAARQAAFEYALGIWSALIGSNYTGETITIHADMESMGGTANGATLGFGGSPLTWRDFGEGVPGTFYGNALTNHLYGSDFDPNSVEITTTFNVDVDNPTVLGSTDFYYGLDANPGVHIDFVTVVLHEIGHGLNFFDLINSATGAWRNGFPGIYDRFLERGDGTDLTAMSDSERLAAITSGDLFWNGAFGIAGNGGSRPRIYAPDPYEPGSSLGHLDETVHEDDLMSPIISGPDHTPGPIVLGMMQDMGWNVVQGGSPVSDPITVGPVTVNVTVNPVNDAPVAVADTYATSEDTALVVAATGVLANDADVDGDALTAVLVTGVSNGTLALNADGSFTYTPNANFNGTDSFTYKANDGALDSNTVTVTITVNAVNDAPVATNDTYSTDEDAALTIAAPGVLGNDSDVDGDALTAVLEAGPANGTLTLNPDGSFTYTPNADFNGTDSFTYKANDGSLDSNVATVTITVNPLNDAPAAADDAYSTNEDIALTIAAPGVLGNDSDIDGDALTAALVAGPSNGTLTLNADGSFTYTPNADFNGTDSFTYRASDGTANSSTAAVTITVNAVNDAPVAAGDSYSTDEDVVLTIAAPGVLGNDTDIDGDALTAALVDGPANGTLTLNADGSFTYTPNADFNGTDSFTYRANDGTTDSGTATVTITVSAVNDAPAAVNDSYSTDEDTPLTVPAAGVLANDTDVDEDTLTAVLVSGPSNGTLTLNADGSFTYTPDADFNGTDSFTYRANDGTTDSDAATVTITVNAVNDAPVAVGDSYSVDEDATLTVSGPGVLGNDTDVDEDTLTAVLEAGPSNGTLTLNSDGSFTYTPDADFNGSDSFTYKASDGTTNSNTATVTITVNAVNDAPVAANDTYSTDEDTALTIAAPGVLGNDSDVDEDSLTAVLVDGPSNGTLTLSADGSFTYTPNADFNGTDTFTYKANDGTADSGTASVTITVNAVNDAPVAADDAYSTNEDTALTIAAPGLLANDSDIDGDALTAALVDGPSNGTLTLNADGSFTYTPNDNFNGTDTFTYKANDGTADSGTATVTITVTAVNDAPVAADDSYTTDEDTALTVPAAGVLSNDTDVDGDSLTAVLVSGPANGALTLNADGSFTYTPGADFHGTDSFTYKASDGTAESTAATVTITVEAVNDAPVARDDFYSVDENQTLTVAAAAGVLSNDTDVDDDALTAVLVSGPANGALTLNADGSFTYTPNAGFDGTDTFTYQANDGATDSNVATVTISVGAVNDAPVAVDDAYSTDEDTALVVAAPGVLTNDTDLDGDSLTAILVSGPADGTLTLNADGSFTYTPDADFNGTDSFTYKANDGTVDGNVATVTITVNAVNDAPVAANDSYSTDEDVALTVPIAGVLSNDTDVDGDSLTAVLVSGPANGALTLNADGSFTYTPNSDFNGTDAFTYKANDGTADSGTATVTITVNAVNDAPAAADDAYSTDEDTALTVAAPGVLANDSDTENDTLTAVLDAGPSNGTLTLNADGSFTYTPDADFNGTDSFTYKANDGTADSATATVTITVNAVNDAPAAADDAYSTSEDTALIVAAPGVLDNDGDVDGDTLTAALVAGPSNGTLTLNADGSFTYTPNADFNGTDSFTYRTNDGSLDSNVATVAITVNAVNDAPIAVNDAYSTDEDTPLTVPAAGVLANDTDVDGDALTAVLDVGPSNGTLTLNADGSFTYTPNANFNGTDSFSYQANDGTADSNVATVTITVNAVNDAPVAADDSYTTDEDTALTVPAAGVLVNDTDVDGDALTAVLVSGPANGTLTLNADGSFTYTPNADFHGTDSFTYRANDGALDSNVATVTITVNPVNDAPVAADESYTTDEDTALTVPAAGVLANDTDVDGDSLTAVLVSGPANGTLTLNADGSFTYTPSANFNGTDSFTYRANDGSADSAPATVTITVTPVNDAPVAADDSYSTDEDVALTVTAPGVLDNDTDVDGDSLTVVLVDGPTHGTLVLNADGSFTYTPGLDFVGNDSFTYRANDGSTDSNVATVRISVGGENDAPVAADDSYSTDEDVALTIAAPGVLANDSDAENDALTAVLATGPSNGALTLNADGSFTYTPDADFHGTDSFTYRANDGSLNSEVATVTITVNAVNDAPVAVNDSYSTDEDTALTVPVAGVLANDTDVDGDALTAVLETGPSNGTLTLNADGSFTYTPDADFNGTDSFTYKANDGTTDSGAVTVTITVNAVNDAPVAADDSYTTSEDTALTVAAPGVLSNDTDVDGDTLTAILVSGPANGGLTLNADGSFTYTPDADFHGTDSFTYKANDSTADSGTATVTINVSAINDAPAAADDSYTTSEDTALTVAAPGVLGNDGDIDGDALTAVLVDGPASGTLTLNADGSFTYTPNADFNGTDSFTYKANDGTADSDTATVTITVDAVNDAPVAEDDFYSAVEDTTLIIAAPGVLANDSDADGDLLTAVLATGPANGTLALNSDGSFTYTPDADFHGLDTFTYRASDGTAQSNLATVTIRTAPVNDAPVAVDDSYTTDEDTELTVVAPGVLSNDTDVDGNALTAALVSGPSNGALTLNADGSFTYTPNVDFNGTDTFTYKANDGTTDSGTATVTITVNAVNDPPLAGNDSYSTDEDVPLVVTAPGVLANDSDVEGSALTAVLVSGPANGTLTLDADGSFTYTPDADFHGTDSFTYRANDGSLDSDVATVTITVNAVNDAPVATDDSYSTDEDVALTVDAPGVLANDTDVDGNALTAVLVAGPSSGTLVLNADGSFTYTPELDFVGNDSFTYRANDGSSDSNVATVQISVGGENDAPVAAGDSYSTDEDVALTIAAPGVLANDSDVENDTLTAVLEAGPSNGTLTLNADGSFTYTPDADFHGTDSFTYKANDGSLDSDAATVTITVNAVNDVPVAADDSYSTDEDAALTVPAAGVLANDSDVDGDTLTAALVDSPANGTLTLNADGSFTYTPNADFHGTDSFTYKANDGSLDSNVATVTITVSPVNDAPVAADDSYSTDEDTALTVPAPGVLGNDSDIEGDALTATLVAGPANGTLTLNADGSFTYTPNADFHGTDSFTYRASDGSLGSAPATVSITVNPVNDAPAAQDDAYSVDEDTALTVAGPGVLGNDSDVDGDALSAALVSGPANGTLTLNADGSFAYTPDADFHGTDSFTYRASDGSLQSEAVVTITVNPVNDAPVALADSYSTQEDTTLTVPAAGVLANDTDVDGDSPTAVLVSGPANGSLTLNADGSFTYTPNADFHGTDSFTYRANDGTADSDAATVTITVTPVNDAPAAADDAYTTLEDTSLTVDAPGVLANDLDVDGDDLSAVFVSGPSNGSLSLNPDGSFTYTPDAGFRGTDSFTYRATDGAAQSDIATVTITVRSLNEPPVALDDAYQVDEDAVLNVPAAGVLQNDTDPDGDSLTALLVDGPANGELVLNADGSFTYTPDADFFGTDTFTYRAGDGTGESNVATVTITVDPVNDPPVATDAAFELDENSPNGTFVGQVQATDVDSTTLTYSIVGGSGSDAFAIDAATGRITVADYGLLDFERNEEFTIAVLVQDDGEPSASDTATITVRLNDLAEIDIEPGDSTNTINLQQKGVPVEVAILSTEFFDATTQVDLGSLRFGRVGNEDSLVRHPVRIAKTELRDVNGDGRLDLIVYFDKGATGLQPEDTHAVLTGQRTDGTAFTARQDVRVLGLKGKGRQDNDKGGNGKGNDGKGKGSKGNGRDEGLSSSFGSLADFIEPSASIDSSALLADGYWTALEEEIFSGRNKSARTALDDLFEAASREGGLWLG